MEKVTITIPKEEYISTAKLLGDAAEFLKRAQAENKRLKDLNAQLLEACKAVFKLVEREATNDALGSGLGVSEWEAFIDQDVLEKYKAAIDAAEGE